MANITQRRENVFEELLAYAFQIQILYFLQSAYISAGKIERDTSRFLLFTSALKVRPLAERHFRQRKALFLSAVLFVVANEGLSSDSLCTACWAGYYSPTVGANTSSTCIQCPSNHSQPIAGAGSRWDCIPCSSGQVNEGNMLIVAQRSR